jgi:salicylate hydroxylase
MDAIEDAPIADIPVDEPFRTRFGNPYAVVHRADLHGVLVKACMDSPLIEMRTDARVVAYDQKGDTVTAILADGSRIAGGLLIGADGLRSAIRAQLVGDGEPRVSGHTTYRSVIPTEKMPEELRWNAATLWAGPKCHIVHYPLSGWKVFNLVATCHDDAPEPVSGQPVSKQEMRKGFEHVAARPLSIIDNGEDWRLWVLCDREPCETWVDGRVVLLGDAAHPTLQYMAQGACMALEDAVCLSHKLESHDGDVDAALEDYRLERIPRTARVQMGSRLMGDHIFHPSGARAMLRNSIMRAKAAEDYYNDLQWLYGGTGLGG